MISSENFSELNFEYLSEGKIKVKKFSKFLRAYKSKTEYFDIWDSRRIRIWIAVFGRNYPNLQIFVLTLMHMLFSVLMGATQSVMYIAPALNIKMSLRERLYISGAIQLMVCLIETLETLVVQVLNLQNNFAKQLV